MQDEQVQDETTPENRTPTTDRWILKLAGGF
jgi:hypothetical protein